jgi:hypothetical protein
LVPPQDGLTNNGKDEFPMQAASRFSGILRRDQKDLNGNPVVVPILRSHYRPINIQHWRKQRIFAAIHMGGLL